MKRTVWIFALLGVATGIVSYLSFKYGNEFLTVSLLGRRGGTVVPGVVFGLLVVACNYHFGIRNPLTLLITLLLTIATWLVAFDVTESIAIYLGEFQRHPLVFPSDASPSNPDVVQVIQREKLPLQMAVSFGIGGFVGGLGTALAVAVANPRFRRLDAWAVTIGLAVLFGALVEVYGLYGDLPALALFTTWQAAVIGSIARTLSQAPAPARGAGAAAV